MIRAKWVVRYGHGTCPSRNRVPGVALRPADLGAKRVSIRNPLPRGVWTATIALALGILLSGLLSPFAYDLATAQNRLTPEMALERLFTTDEIDPDWFSKEILAEVSVHEVRTLIEQLTGDLGALQRIESVQPFRFEVFFERGLMPVQIVLDAQGRITGLFFESPRPLVSGFDDVLAMFAELPGLTSVFVLADGQPLATHNSTQPLAVGSTFKLAVLAALLMDIEEGLRAWDDVVPLDDAWRSLPTGVLQDWPAGAPVTLHTLATNMISISDNTATDGLIHIVGRDKAGMFTRRNDPLLTTRETFILKNPNNVDVLADYRAGDAVKRRALLAQIQHLPLIEAANLVQPTAHDIDWFFTTEEACGLMAYVQHVPLMSINPGVANPGEWQHVAFKGGSMPGVLNFTTWLIGASEASYCVSATWNDVNNLDELHFVNLYRVVLDAIKLTDATR